MAEVLLFHHAQGQTEGAAILLLPGLRRCAP